MKRLIIVRHGKTAWNEEGRLMGSTNIPLSLAGRKDSELLLKKLGNIVFDHAFTSTSLRALETTDILTAGIIPVTKLEALRERNQGILEGLKKEEIDRNYSHAWSMESVNDPWFNKLEKRETLYEVFVRVMDATRQILDHPAETILVVSHGSPIRLMQYMFSPKKINFNPFEIELPHCDYVDVTEPQIYPYSLLE